MTDTEALFDHPAPPTRPADARTLAALNELVITEFGCPDGSWSFWALSPKVPWPVETVWLLDGHHRLHRALIDTESGVIIHRALYVAEGDQ